MPQGDCRGGARTAVPPIKRSLRMQAQLASMPVIRSPTAVHRSRRAAGRVIGTDGLLRRPSERVAQRPPGPPLEEHRCRALHVVRDERPAQLAMLVDEHDAAPLAGRGRRRQLRQGAEEPARIKLRPRRRERPPDRIRNAAHAPRVARRNEQRDNGKEIGGPVAAPRCAATSGRPVDRWGHWQSARSARSR